MSPLRHHRDENTEDEEVVWDAPSRLMDGVPTHERVPMLRCDYEAIDHDAAFWEVTVTNAPSQTPRHGAATSSVRANIADAIFFSLMGAIVGYAMLLASGTLYRGKPDMADAMRWRMWRDGRMALVDVPRLKTNQGGEPLERLLPTAGSTVTSASQAIRTACSPSACTVSDHVT